MFVSQLSSLTFKTVQTCWSTFLGISDDTGMYRGEGPGSGPLFHQPFLGYFRVIFYPLEG